MPTFTVLGLPATKGSTRSFVNPRTGKVVTKADCQRLPEWTQAVGWAAKAARLTVAPRSVGVSVFALFEFKRPSRAKRRRFPTVRPDGDKLARGLLDALSGIAYFDDSQVVSLSVEKRYGAVTQAIVTVERME